MTLSTSVSSWHATPVQGRHHKILSAPKLHDSPLDHHKCCLTGLVEKAEVEEVVGHDAKQRHTRLCLDRQPGASQQSTAEPL